MSRKQRDFYVLFFRFAFNVYVEQVYKHSVLVCLSEFPYAILKIHACSGPPVVYKRCDVSSPVELFVSALRDHVLHSALLPNYLSSNGLAQRYSHHESLSLSCSLRRNQSQFFLYNFSLLFAYKNRGPNGVNKEIGSYVFTESARTDRMRYRVIFKRSLTGLDSELSFS